ncbi:uncharacterized protein LOC129606930 [Condylostylus longicornis]|uniref:uncharacterized protein LOC129606930 n=1 Tax=Condylostylus longicornis TaxID=2530218 RepID=UPI00244DEADA|nr:uncharacterized protein LOC129606930 [Condylostylus longicornis]
MWRVLFVAQFFAMMPVVGIFSSHPNKVKFKLISIPVLTTFTFFIAAILLLYAFLDKLLQYGIDAKNTVGVVFFSCGILACVLFFRLATKWPKLIRYWSKSEAVFLRYPYEKPSLKLSTRIRVASLIILILALLEHGAFFMSVLYTYFKHSALCNITDTSFKKFMIDNYAHVFEKVEYNLVLSIFFLILNGIFTLIWNYLDLFIALISLGIVTRFEQLNTRITSLAKQKSPEEVWSEIREHFVKLCDLIDVVDDHLSPIIIERLTNQMSTQLIALSGMKFFFLTRKLLFGMAGTIVTYELVLLQFDEKSTLKKLSTNQDISGTFHEAIGPVEHILYLINAMNNTQRQINFCNMSIDFWENFYRRERNHLETVIQFRMWLLPLLENMSEFVWINVRGDFLKIKNLLSLVNDNTSSLLIASLSSNMFLICVQLFNMNRTVTVMFVASSVNNASNNILSLLRNIPSESWSIETQLFSNQLYYDFIGLSPKGFFQITRKLLVGMTTTIITYELVLLDASRDFEGETSVICPFIFFTSSTISSCVFLNLGRKWPKVVRWWYKIDEIFLENYIAYLPKKSIIFRIRWIGCLLVLGFIIEHALYLITSLQENHKYITTCNVTNEFWENYVKRDRKQFFEIISYRWWMAPINEMAGTILGYVLVLLDSDDIMSNDECGKLRLRYNQLLNLLSHVDRILAVIILISFSNNLYYICVQLFHSVSPATSLLRSIYFWYSLIFLICRTVLVSLCASKIYDESRKPLKILRAIPGQCYKIEAKRFLEQVINTQAALSGMNFFHITRKFMLSIAGTIVTYELVLIQLHFTFDKDESPKKKHETTSTRKHPDLRSDQTDTELYSNNSGFTMDYRSKSCIPTGLAYFVEVGRYRSSNMKHKKSQIWDKNILSDKMMNNNIRKEIEYQMRNCQTFHKTVRICLFIGQCFALMPVTGITASSASYLKFKWKDLRTICSICLIICGFSYAAINLNWILSSKMNFGSFAFVSLCASKIYDESKKPLKILRSIPGKFYKNEAKRFLELIVNTQAALSGMNFFHITRKFMLSVAGTIVTYELVLIQLHFTFDTEGGQDPCLFIGQCFALIPVSGITGAFIWFINASITMCEFVRIARKWPKMLQNWENIELNHMVHYRNCSTDKSNRVIKYTTIFMLICLTFEHTMSIIKDIKMVTVCSENDKNILEVYFHQAFPIPARSSLRAIYFWFSLTFLIFRTMSVSLCASKIYDESKKPLIILRSIPGKCYKKEARRFVELITNTQAALTGKNFFYITKKLMLSVAGTIVTYEKKIDKNFVNKSVHKEKLKYLSTDTKDDLLRSGSFYEAMGPVLILTQLFGFMPVGGIYKKNSQDLYFKWSNIRTLHSIFVVLSEIFCASMTYIWVFSRPIQFKSSEPVIFYTLVIIVSIKLIFVAQKWPDLMQHWERVETKLPPHKTHKQKFSLKRRIRNITIIGMGLSLVEHVLSTATVLYYVKNCPMFPDSPWDSYLYSASDSMFAYFEYSRWLGIFSKYIGVLCTFLWTYMDIFVMIISVGLSERFKQVNESLMEVKGLQMPQSFWLEHRLHYRALCVLCDEVDDVISLITLISFSNNLYFVCGKLLRSINKKPSLEHGLYFWFSLIFLLGRTLMISLYSSEINDEAKKPIKVFRSVPRESWCQEVKRFSEEVSSDVIALTGMKFFHITRSVVITVAGTIVTYELVLIQFTKDDAQETSCKNYTDQLKMRLFNLNNRMKNVPPNKNSITNEVKVHSKRKEVIINVRRGEVTRPKNVNSSQKIEIFPRKSKFFQRGNKNSFIYNGSFYEAIGPVLIFAQCFALMPVAGIREKSAAHLSFSWKNFRTIYSITYFFCILIDSIITIYWYFDENRNFNDVDPVIFHISNIVISLSFIKLAREWPNLMLAWERNEKEIPPYTNQKKKRSLAYKIQWIMSLAVVLSMTEHILNMISLVHYANYCPNANDPIESFFRSQLSHIFHFFEYDPALAIYGKILNIFLTFGWNFMDAFIMIISVGLKARFKQINDNLERYRGQAMSNEFWSNYRNYYRNACSLCEKVDNAISFIMMASFSNNLYFICVQLLKSLNKMPSFAHGLYFYFSLGFLIGRTLAVSLTAASINVESKKPLEIFRSVPKDSWVSEVKRFTDDVNQGLVALSGMKFFYITKTLVLTIAGTIVTYELVLIQFHENEITLGCYGEKT